MFYSPRALFLAANECGWECVWVRWWRRYSHEVEFVVFAFKQPGTRKLLFQSWRIHISFRSPPFRCRTLWNMRIWWSNATRRSVLIRKWRVYRVCCARIPSPQTGSLCHGTTLLMHRLISSSVAHDSAIPLRPHFAPPLPSSSSFPLFITLKHMYFLNNCFWATTTLRGYWPEVPHSQSIRLLRFTFLVMSEHRNIHKPWLGKTWKLLLLYKFVHSTKKEKETMKYPNTCSLSGM